MLLAAAAAAAAIVLSAADGGGGGERAAEEAAGPPGAAPGTGLVKWTPGVTCPAGAFEYDDHKKYGEMGFECERCGSLLWVASTTATLTQGRAKLATRAAAYSRTAR